MCLKFFIVVNVWKFKKIFIFNFSFRYLNTYKKYSDLLNNNADQDVSAFLRETHSIEAFKKVTTKRPYNNKPTISYTFQFI